MLRVAAILDVIGQAVWRASWQASALAVVVLAAVMLMRGPLLPAWRYGLWSLVLARLLLPLAPQARWMHTPLVEAREGPNGSAGSTRVATESDEIAPGLASTGEPAGPAARPPMITFPRIAACVWLAGAVAMTIGLGRRARRLRRAAAGWPDVADRRVRELLTDCQARLGLRRPVRLCMATDDTGPAVLGLWRPRIVLPAAILVGFGAIASKRSCSTSSPTSAVGTSSCIG